jgi:redox-regulated HSP33 family molecular chaperone
MCSFRAEGYGFLAGISLLLSILKAFHKPANEMHTIHKDSASLLARLATALSSHNLVGFWLKTDSDLVMQIANEASGFTHLD